MCDAEIVGLLLHVRSKKLGVRSRRSTHNFISLFALLFCNVKMIMLVIFSFTAITNRHHNVCSRFMASGTPMHVIFLLVNSITGNLIIISEFYPLTTTCTFETESRIVMRVHSCKRHVYINQVCASPLLTIPEQSLKLEST